MAKKNVVGEFWEGIPPGLKLAGGVLFAFIIYKKIQREIQNARALQQAQQQAQQQGQELDQFIQQGQNLTYPLGQYAIMADTLQVAMEGPWYDPTDEDAVKGVLNQLVHNADFLQLQKVFGIRDDWNLARWIRGDFTQSEINKLNSILASKGIVYQF